MRYYVTIAEIAELPISLKEVVALSIIYQFSQDGEGAWFGTLDTMMTYLKCQREAANKTLKSLVEKGYVKKSKLYQEGKCICMYKVSNDFMTSVRKSNSREFENRTDASSKIELTTSLYINNIKEEYKEESEPSSKASLSFSKPSIDDVEAYIKDKNYQYVDASSFVNFYEAKGWKVGRNAMKNWQAAVAGWESRSKKEAEAKKPAQVNQADQFNNEARLRASESYELKK